MEFKTDRNTEEVENIAAAENDVGQRLDIYLAAKLEVSRSNMQKLLEEGRVFRGAKVFKANYKVKACDVFTVMHHHPTTFINNNYIFIFKNNIQGNSLRTNF